MVDSLTMEKMKKLQHPVPVGYERYPALFVSKNFRERLDKCMNYMSRDGLTVYTAFESGSIWLRLALNEYSRKSVEERVLLIAPELIESVREYVYACLDNLEKPEEQYIQFLKNYDGFVANRRYHCPGVFIGPIHVRKHKI
jgi:hypothetical protein